MSYKNCKTKNYPIWREERHHSRLETLRYNSTCPKKMVGEKTVTANVIGKVLGSKLIPNIVMCTLSNHFSAWWREGTVILKMWQQGTMGLSPKILGRNYHNNAGTDPDPSDCLLGITNRFARHHCLIENYTPSIESTTCFVLNPCPLLL